MTKNMINFPKMRAELLDNLKELSDLEFQRNNWGAQNGLGEAASTLDYSIHFLFDDTSLSSDPLSCVGIFLFNYNEADAISKLVCQLSSIFHKYGTDLTDLEYTTLPEWRSVLTCAHDAVVLLQQNSEKFDDV